MAVFSKMKDKAYRMATGIDPSKLGHGPYSEADDIWVEEKPYVAHYRNGIFIGHDGTMWAYFAFPNDVQVKWLPNDYAAIENQSFFVDLIKDLASLFSSQEDKLRDDLRRDFHIQITQEPSTGITPPVGSSPAHADSLRRAGALYTKPLWVSFMGVRILEGSLFATTYSWKDKIKQYIDSFTELDAMRAKAFETDLKNVTGIFAKHGFRTLDFEEDNESFERLTAWYGVPDTQFGLSRQLQNSKIWVPAHNKSIITPRWGELYMSAIRPSERIDFTDPLSTSRATRWGSPLLSPSSDVVAINIRGQIRSDDVVENMLEMKSSTKSKTSGSKFGSLSFSDLVGAASNSVVKNRIPALDNTEIIVASKVPKTKTAETSLQKMFRNTGMEVALLQDRQDTAILSTLPTYPNHVMRIPRGNAKRPHLTNTMLPGVLAFSSLFRSAKPLAPGGIFLGLGDDDALYPEIYVELDAASRYGGSPTWLVSGRPGAGKTQAMLQITAQGVMQGAFTAYFNPKQTGTLKPVFDYLGGVTVSMNRNYLVENPGLADPFFFLDDRDAIAATIADAITTSMKMNYDSGSDATRRRTAIQAEVKERALMPANKTASDIIFGNERAGTPPLTDEGVVEFVRDKREVSPFWRSFLAPPNGASVISERMRKARAILFEWDDSMNLPDVGKSPAEYTDSEVDTMLSLVTMFQYSIARARAVGSESVIICDEAHVLKGSEEAMNIIVRAGREWRQANINLILGTQEMRDFLLDEHGNDGEMSSYIGRYVIMAIAETATQDLEQFFKVSHLPKDYDDPRDLTRNRYAKYIIGAAADGKKARASGNRIVRAFLVDTVYDWRGGIIVGPWPKRELDLGRTDKDAEELRKKMAISKTYNEILQEETEGRVDYTVKPEQGSYGGFLAEVMSDPVEDISVEEGNEEEVEE